MKNIHKLITKDIFNCLTEEERKNLTEWRQKSNIDEVAYTRMKKMIVGQDLHETVMCSRKKRKVVFTLLRYAALFVLPLTVAAYFLWWQGKETKQEIVRNETSVMEQVPSRKQPHLILATGQVLDIRREKIETRVTPNVTSDGESLVYERQDIQPEKKEVEFHTVVVPEGGEYSVTLSDGTKVWFNEDTELRFPVAFAGKQREVYLEKGEVYFDVEKDKEHPFVVHTANGEVRVLGTEFCVEARENNKIRTTLVEGSVVIARNDKEVILEPNQRATVNEGIVVEQVDVEEIICWKDKMFVFKDVELGVILNKLSDWYGFEVFYQNPEAKAERYYVSIDKYATPNKILEIIGEVGAVKFEVNGKMVKVFK